MFMYITQYSQHNLYVYNIVIYVTQDATETTDEDTRQAIVPLVLPT